MEIQIRDNGLKGAFFISENGEDIALMTFVWSGKDKIIIDHTEVSEQLGGQGIGKKLVNKAADFAREKNIKIMPLCPFAKKVMEGNEAYQDVLF